MRWLVSAVLVLVACGAKPDKGEKAEASKKGKESALEIGSEPAAKHQLVAPAPDCPPLFDGVALPEGAPSDAEARAIEKAAAILHRDQKNELSPDEATEFARELTQARKATLLHMVGLQWKAEGSLEADKLATFNEGMKEGFRSLVEGTDVMLLSLKPYDHAPLDPYREDLVHLKTIAQFHLGEAADAEVEKYGGPECMRRPVDDETLLEFADLQGAQLGI
jgi:hypothetical protein